jgi:DNA-binding NtrC family response regulator
VATASAAALALPELPSGEELLQRPLPTLVAELEARAIQAALAATGGNKVAAARRLGIARATLYEKLAQPPSDH